VEDDVGSCKLTGTGASRIHQIGKIATDRIYARVSSEILGDAHLVDQRQTG
jgi:hypothetical protein